MADSQAHQPRDADACEIRLDQVRLLVRNVPAILVTNLVNSLLTVAFFGAVAPPLALGVWLMLVVALSAVGFWMWWVRRDTSVWRGVDASVIRRITLSAAVGGGLWGLFALIVFPPESLAHQVLLALVVGSTAAAALVSLQSIALSHNSYASFLGGVRLRLANADLLERTAVANETLKRNVDELEWSRKRLIQQATQLRKLAQEATLEQRKAEAANLAKSTFLANMSHELRTPLSAIIGFSEIMQHEALGPVGSTRYRAYADDINRSGMHLLGLVNDLLDLSKIEAGKMELVEDFVDVDHLIADCLTLLRESAARAKIELAVVKDARLPPAYADERKLKQILINLLGNAIKFTGAGGSVEVAATVAASGTLQVSVRDSGAGIRPEDVAKVFEPFGQLRGAIESGQPGTGLGLPLSRKLAELHGGTLEIESAEGAGTTVLLSLPPERLRTEAPAPAVAEIAVA